MFGSLISKTIKAATLPLDAVDIGIDLITGGDGSRASRDDSASPTHLAVQARDALADQAEAIDE